MQALRRLCAIWLVPSLASALTLQTHSAVIGDVATHRADSVSVIVAVSLGYANDTAAAPVRWNDLRLTVSGSDSARTDAGAELVCIRSSNGLFLSRDAIVSLDGALTIPGCNVMLSKQGGVYAVSLSGREGTASLVFRAPRSLSLADARVEVIPQATPTASAASPAVSTAPVTAQAATVAVATSPQPKAEGSGAIPAGRKGGQTTWRYAAKRGTISLTPRISMGVVSPGAAVAAYEDSVLASLSLARLRAYRNVVTGEVVFDADSIARCSYSDLFFGGYACYYLSDRIAVGLNYAYHEISQKLKLVHALGTHDPDSHDKSNDDSWSEPFLVSNEIGPILSVRLIQKNKFVLFGTLGFCGTWGTLHRNAALLELYDEQESSLDTVPTVAASIGDIKRANAAVGFSGIGGSIGISAAFFFNPYISLQCWPQLNMASVFFDDNGLTSYPPVIQTL